MTGKNLIFILSTIAASVLLGWLFSWWLTCGMMLGTAVMVYVIYYRWSVVDEIEAEINWVRNFDEYGYADDGSDEPASKWDGIWMMALIVLALLTAITLVAVNLIP